MCEARSFSRSERGRCLYFAFWNCVEGRCARCCRAFCFPLFATFCNYFLFRKFERRDDTSDYFKDVLWSKLQLKDGMIAKGVEQEMDVIVIEVRMLHNVLCMVPGFCFNL